MNLYSRIRLDLKKERVEIQAQEKTIESLQSTVEQPVAR
jgi:hypothetical protein